MREIKGNLWDFHKQGHWVAITTNGVVRADGACVMGRGVALQAKRRFPRLPFELGDKINKEGNRVHLFPEYRIISFPVKHRWFERADIQLIEQSARGLACILSGSDETVYLVRPGCGNGGLLWEVVKPVIAPILNDRFVIVQA